MRKTGKSVYISGSVNHEDIATNPDTNPASYDRGLIPIWENERRGYGYIVRYIASFPSVASTESLIPFITTTYSARDCKALRDGGVAGQNQVDRILGVQAGIHPAGNDRVIATTVTTGFGLEGQTTLKVDALVVQSLSLGIDSNKGKACYYIEMDEYQLTDDELVLALLSENDMNQGNFIVANA